MGSKINFSSYSLNDLYSSAESIDRDMYPERAKEIEDLIRKREAEHPEEIDTTKDIGEKATKTDRLLAALIDGVIAIVAMIPLFNYVGLAAFENPTLPLISGTFIYGVFLTFILHGYLMHYYGQTIGKHFMSIRIENLDGTKASFATIYFKRMLPMQIIGLIPSVGQFISGFINPIFIFGKQRRCLHDYIAKTKVSYTGT
ncbi:MAG: RDD family protein [Paraglaciecola sp.]|uniref:RDD family protein n=1 Tax=Paraglaciecola sp. TaxID=1920173 RepID=UPI003297A75B